MLRGSIVHAVVHDVKNVLEGLIHRLGAPRLRITMGLGSDLAHVPRQGTGLM